MDIQAIFDLTLQRASDLFCRTLYTPDWLIWAVILSISLPHFFYAWLWLNPEPWRKIFGDQAVNAFSVLGAFGKVIQFEAVLIWVWSVRPHGLCLDLSTVQLWQWMAFLLLFTMGQKLNVGIYQAIGIPGVYYGTKLGVKVPWVEGFPFSVVRHPQYVGSAMTVWGVCLFLLSQMPSAELQASLLILASYWTALYVVTGIVEDYL